jgi:TolB-like protein/DNA-binding winged helix-turn-helix (wHTH) protein/Flp pilus assembly protein TadD
MDAPPGFSRRIRTGLFEIDFASGELHKEGRKVPLQGQPLRVLAILLERPGEVISREELQTRLWPAETYVSFDEGLNTAIRKLRVALGDTAENPRFLETIPRRGYRFIAPVQATIPDLVTETPAETPTTTPGKVADVDQTGTAPATPGRRQRWTAISLLVALILTMGGLAYFLHRQSLARTLPMKRIMLAILPFQNLSNDPQQEYFSDGLTEETITDFGQLSPEQLGVIARTSAMAYKHTNKTISEIGRDLGVDYVLEGSVRRSGSEVRVSAQLIRVSDQTHLWAKNYDRELHDVLQIQNELGTSIASQVQLNLTSQRQSDLTMIRTVNPEAYDLYLQGRFYWNERNPAAIRHSIAYFNRAINVDPDFAMAYVGLADAYNISNVAGGVSAEESLPKAKAAALRAIALDPTIAEAHAALGMDLSHYDFDFPGARREFLQAIGLNPNSAYAHFFYANCYLLPMGKNSEAIAENGKALELDPLSLPISNFMGMTYMFAGRYDESRKQFERTIAMDPTFPLAHEYLAWLLAMMGNYEESVQEKEKSELLNGAAPDAAAAHAATLQQAFRKGGERAYWQTILNEALASYQRSQGSTPSAGNVAAVYALAGEKDRAFEWLAKAYNEHDGMEISLVRSDPAFRNLRGDPRFSDLLRRMGLPQ